MTVNAAIHDQCGTGNGIIFSGSGKGLGHQRHFKGTGHVKTVNLRRRNERVEPDLGLIHDGGMPACFDKGKTGVCHINLLLVPTRHPRRLRTATNPLAGGSCAFSFIRTMTVGSGVSPDLLDPRQNGALAGS